MLQGRYSARGGPIKGCTATLMLAEITEKTFPELSWFSGRKKFLSKTILRLGHKKFLT
jgi:hypothetical protein